MTEVTNRIFKMNPDFWQARSPAPDPKVAEKIVNELQLARPNNQLSERTLEECWSTLQRIFMHKSAMQMHAREAVQAAGGGSGGRPEVKPHQCQQCLKSFSSNHQLVQHIRVHTGEKPYKCSYCDRRFKQLSHVQQHTRLHTGERPYKCHLPECGRAFIQLSNLQQHLRNHDAQVERAKNRPFHCNICGKGFATESSLRTHTSKELQLRVPRALQQHAALIGGPNATSCPVCHKMFLGGEALMEHMKQTHKDPNASGIATKRRTANHPCPVCGKHYVNEGSLRKHLACHPETAQLSTSLRMWPCSVCQAVFTHESGLLSHMEHMRMDPKHQFAAQYVLSRAAAERRERESLLAAATVAAVQAHSSNSSGSGGAGPSMCASPSANSDSSGGRMSSPLNMQLQHDPCKLERPNSASEVNMNNNNNNNNNNPGNAIAPLNNHMAAHLGHHLGHLVNHHGADCNVVGPSSAAAVAAVAAAASRMAGGGPQGAEANPAAAAAVAAAMRNMSGAMSGAMSNAMNNVMQAANGGHGGEMNGLRSPSSMQELSQQQEAAMRMQAEALLRSQAEAALRLAVSQAAAASGEARLAVANSAVSNGMHNGTGNGNGMTNGVSNNGNMMNQSAAHQAAAELTEALRLQEQRLEQALRLHGGDPRALGFSLAAQQGN